MCRLVAKSCLILNEKGAWCGSENTKFMDDSPKIGDIIRHRLNKTFFDVCLYYTNLIDYLRIFMALVALFIILQYKHDQDSCSGYVLGVLIFGSVLLGTMNGYVARHFKQSTVMGCGWNWLAYILAQYSLAIWCLTQTMTTTLTTNHAGFGMISHFQLNRS